MLTRLDRASMAHSLEARVPFLSHKMVDWALTMPTDLKLRGRTGKFILREAIKPVAAGGNPEPAEAGLPDPDGGLAARLASAIRARSIWNDSGARGLGYLRPAAVDRLFAEHRRGDADHSRMLYAITVFALWWSDSQARERAQPCRPDGARPRPRVSLVLHKFSRGRQRPRRRLSRQRLSRSPAWTSN